MAIDRWRSTVGYWDLSPTGTTEVSAIAQQRVASEHRRPNNGLVQLSWGMSANSPKKTPMVCHTFPDLKLPLMGVHSSFKPSSTVIHVSTLRLHRMSWSEESSSTKEWHTANRNKKSPFTGGFNPLEKRIIWKPIGMIIIPFVGKDTYVKPPIKLPFEGDFISVYSLPLLQKENH